MPSKLSIDGPLVIDGAPLVPSMLVQRRALHRTYGGNAQGGIAPLGRYRAVFAFTGLSGESHGYHDEWLPDGTFHYYGEGQVGDMVLTKGNAAIDRHVGNDSRLFLFDMNSGKAGAVIYRGEFRIVRRGEDRGPDRNGTERGRYFFDLEPISKATVPTTRVDDDVQDEFDEGREREIRSNRMERNRKAVEAAKRKHGLKCQVCGLVFGETYGSHGAGFIEVHHMIPVADAARRGKQKVALQELAVLCSNCHRMIHRGGRLLSLDELRYIVAAASGRS
jgi:5-methylcytosine-specific restriction protein A